MRSRISIISIICKPPPPPPHQLIHSLILATGKYSDAYWKYLRTCLFVNVLAFQGFADHCEESRGRVVPALLKRIEARYQHGPSDDKFIQSLKISAAATTTSVSVQSKFDLTQHIFESLSSLHFITIRFGREGFRAWQYVLACSLSWMVRTTDATGLQVGRASGGKKKYSPMIDGIVVKVARNWLDHLEGKKPVPYSIHPYLLSRSSQHQLMFLHPT